MADSVNHPPHYNDHPVCEAIEICEDVSFNVGNAIKYLWRAGKKDAADEDLAKAAWYLKREKQRIADQRYGNEPIIGAKLDKLVRIVAFHPETPIVLKQVLNELWQGATARIALQAAFERVQEFIKVAT